MQRGRAGKRAGSTLRQNETVAMVKGLVLAAVAVALVAYLTGAMRFSPAKLQAMRSSSSFSSPSKPSPSVVSLRAGKRVAEVTFRTSKIYCYFQS